MGHFSLFVSLNGSVEIRELKTPNILNFSFSTPCVFYSPFGFPFLPRGRQKWKKEKMEKWRIKKKHEGCEEKNSYFSQRKSKHIIQDLFFCYLVFFFQKNYFCKF
jgi:hypothetical protein